MSPDAMNALFKPTIDSIIEHLRKYQPVLGHSVGQSQEGGRTFLASLASVCEVRLAGGLGLGGTGWGLGRSRRGLGLCVGAWIQAFQMLLRRYYKAAQSLSSPWP